MFIICILRLFFSQRELPKSIQSRILHAICLFNEHFDVFVSQRHSSFNLIFVSRPAKLPVNLITSNCPTNKLWDTGPVLSILLNRTLTDVMFSLVKNLFNTHGSSDFAFRFACFCSLACFCSPKFRHILLPKTSRLITFVFFEESRLSFKFRVGIYNCEILFSFAKRRIVWMEVSTCRTAHRWKNTMRGSWLEVSLFSHVRKAMHDIWLVYIGLRTKIYFAACQCVNLSMYIINGLLSKINGCTLRDNKTVGFIIFSKLNT